MRSFGDKLRARGMGLGIYTSHGNLTCQKYPGSYGYEAMDAAAYASWGVSFVKNDWCSNRSGFPAVDDLPVFDAMRDALGAAAAAAGTPPMVYSIHWNYWNTKGPGPGCPLATSCPLPAVANMWRIGNDIGANWNSVLGLIDVDEPLAANAGPGRWNDADMMQVGNGMTEDQDRAHMTMWCMLSSPLVAGNDVRTMSNATRAILTNAHAIAVNQDLLGLQATLVNGSAHPTVPSAAAAPSFEHVLARAAQTPPLQVWAKRLSSPAGAWALALLNRDEHQSGTVIAHFAEAVGAKQGAKYDVLDLWAGAASIGVHTDSVSAKLAPSSAAMYKLVPAAGHATALP
jgi:alpha-galactosidase